MSAPRQLIGIQEAAARCNVSQWTVRNWISSGRLTGYRMGPRLIRVEAAELERLFKVMPTTAGHSPGQAD
jgi:excisionase family DNA binding protein